MGYVILLWHSLSLPYNYFAAFTVVSGTLNSTCDDVGYLYESFGRNGEKHTAGWPTIQTERERDN